MASRSQPAASLDDTSPEDLMAMLQAYESGGRNPDTQDLPQELAVGPAAAASAARSTKCRLWCSSSVNEINGFLVARVGHVAKLGERTGRDVIVCAAFGWRIKEGDSCPGAWLCGQNVGRCGSQGIHQRLRLRQSGRAGRLGRRQGVK